MTTHAPLAALVRADMNRHTADDLAASLSQAGWRGAGTRVPTEGPPEVTFPLNAMHAGLRRLVSSLPSVLEAWRHRHELHAYEITVVSGSGHAVHRVVAGDPSHDALAALVVGIAEVLARDGAAAATV